MAIIKRKLFLKSCLLEGTLLDKKISCRCPFKMHNWQAFRTSNVTQAESPLLPRWPCSSFVPNYSIGGHHQLEYYYIQCCGSGFKTRIRIHAVTGHNWSQKKGTVNKFSHFEELEVLCWGLSTVKKRLAIFPSPAGMSLTFF